MKKISLEKKKKPSILPEAGVLHSHMQKGMTQTEIAALYGVTTSAINVKLRRAGFAPIREYGGRKYTGHRVIAQRAAIMEQYPAPSEIKHSDRVQRVTITGAVVTVRRLTFLDGPALQSGE
jgi:hypothetical protein